MINVYFIICTIWSNTLLLSLLSDDPATWAALMAACHTENTCCYLSGSSPRRQGMEQSLMAIVSKKGVGIGYFIYFFIYLAECVLSEQLTFLCPSVWCRGNWATTGSVSRGMGAATGGGWSHDGRTAGTSWSSVLSGEKWTPTNKRTSSAYSFIYFSMW